MKILKNYKIKLLLIAFVLICTFANISFAENEIITDITTSEEVEEQSKVEDEKKDGDLYLFKNQVSIDEKVDGNIFIIANTVNINAEIDGNVFILASEVNILSKSYIYGTAFISANKITINGYINDLYCTAQNLKLGTNATIIRDAHIATEKICLNGEFRKNLYLISDNISLNNASTSIEGNLEYSYNEEIIPKDLVNGEINYKQSKSSSTFLNYIVEATYVCIIAIIVTIIILIRGKITKTKIFVQSKFLLENKFYNFIFLFIICQYFLAIIFAFFRHLTFIFCFISFLLFCSWINSFNSLYVNSIGI